MAYRNLSDYIIITTHSRLLHLCTTSKVTVYTLQRLAQCVSTQTVHTYNGCTYACLYCAHMVGAVYRIYSLFIVILIQVSD